jgi:ubiquinone biosynthesis monooxygenase Coq7
MRHLSLSDRLLDELQHGLSTCHLRPPAAERGYPADSAEKADLSEQEQAHVAGLMRVNNAGEVAAQGLYRGQALGARKQAISDAMKEAAEEENEHLNWCQRRLGELEQGRSLLDGVWYWGSFTIGALAGAAGDKWSLGFVKETEQQVCAHLDEHLQRLPELTPRHQRRPGRRRRTAASGQKSNDPGQQGHDLYRLPHLVQEPNSRGQFRNLCKTRHCDTRRA